MQTKPHLLNSPIRKLTCGAMCLALCLVLPFLTGQIPQVGSALLPMHIPVLLAGFLCGPWWALLVGTVAPLLRHILFSMPPLLTAIAMSFELATYGVVTGLVSQKTGRRLSGIYAALISAMISGRVVWGIIRVLMTGVSGEAFTWGLFLAGALTTAVPGILLQLIVIPVLVTALRRANYIE